MVEEYDMEIIWLSLIATIATVLAMLRHNSKLKLTDYCKKLSMFFKLKYLTQAFKSPFLSLSIISTSSWRNKCKLHYLLSLLLKIVILLPLLQSLLHSNLRSLNQASLTICLITNCFFSYLTYIDTHPSINLVMDHKLNVKALAKLIL